MRSPCQRLPPIARTRDKKLPVPAVPCKTQKRGLELPGDVALSAVGWSPTPITDKMRLKLDCEGSCQECGDVVPWNGDRPRPRMPSRGFSVPTTPTRCSSTPPGPTSCWRTPSRRSPTRCQTPPSSQPWWPSVSACAVRPPRTAQQTQVTRHHYSSNSVEWKLLTSVSCHSSNHQHLRMRMPGIPSHRTQPGPVHQV